MRRRGELMALRWQDVDLGAGLIRVERSYDPTSGEYVAPKSRAGVRRVPIAAVLREYLIAHRLRSGRSGGLAFGKTAETPRSDASIRKLAAKAWLDAGLEPIGLKPACPAEATTTPVTGTVVAADVVGIGTQGMPAGSLDAIIQEIREGFAYANLHTQTSPGGEIRGEIREHHGA